MKLTVRGFLVHEFWSKIPNHFSNVELDEFMVMPNHVHGIIVINDEFCGANEYEGGETPPLRKKITLGQIIAYYKYQTTKIINKIDGNPGMRIWQRNYYDRIIRHQKILDIARQYIVQNPWR